MAKRKRKSKEQSGEPVEAEKVPIPSASGTAHRYRLLARQPTAVNVSAPQPFSISPSGFPLVSLRPVHKDPLEQMQFGGTIIAIEYESAEDDLLRAMHAGLELIEDVLAALSLHSAIRFGRTVPLQLVESTPNLAERRLLIPVQIAMDAADSKIDATAMDFVRKAILHWDNLDTGHRLRRAARKYARGLAEPDATDAFQAAYVGLEVLEKPLAEEYGILPGVEVMTGTCKSCNATFTYNKTALAAVKKYVTGAHGGTPMAERIKDWKECLAVRNDLAHGLKDLSEVEGRAHGARPAIFHYLHDACVHLTHEHELESENYRFASRQQFFLLGLLKDYVPGHLEQFDLLLKIQLKGWADDEEHGPVPELEMNNVSGLDVGLLVRSLHKPLSNATEDDLGQFEIKDMGRTRATEGKQGA